MKSQKYINKDLGNIQYIFFGYVNQYAKKGKVYVLNFNMLNMYKNYNLVGTSDQVH
jgi:hypothetical protein